MALWNASWIPQAPGEHMGDQQFEFVDESEEPHLRGTPSPGTLTGWETVVFLVAEPDDDTNVTPGGADE